uniref:F-box domain-containing protein n=1 Tax=Mycena chlorophos TaxID=658473 RepID=A0ABQ0L7M0_MYCCL|nr:predicted protein [Mycena chlorophos]
MSSELEPPIFRLPTELLVKILDLGSQGQYGDPQLHRLANARLLRLSKVCSRWHTVALGTPALWATIHVRVNLSTRVPSDSSLRNRLETRAEPLLRAALERSENTPLTLMVDLRPEWTDGLLQMLMQQSERWLNVDLTLYGHSIERIRDAKNRLPLLRRLSLALLTGFDDPPCNAFAVAPALTHVSLYAPGWPPPSLPWSQLHELNVDPDTIADNSASMDEAMGCLCFCPSNCSVTISDIYVDATGWQSPVEPTITSPIEVLHLEASQATNEHTSPPETLARVFESLNLAHLRDLDIRSSLGKLLSWSPEAFSAFGGRSRLITRLFLKNIIIHDHELVKALAVVPALRDLSISDIHNSDADVNHQIVTAELYRQLTRNNSRSSLVPHLQRLSCASLFEEPENDALLRALLESRIKAPDVFKLDCGVYASAELHEVGYDLSDTEVRMERLSKMVELVGPGLNAYIHLDFSDAW